MGNGKKMDRNKKKKKQLLGLKWKTGGIGTATKPQ